MKRTGWPWRKTSSRLSFWISESIPCFRRHLASSVKNVFVISCYLPFGSENNKAGTLEWNPGEKSGWYHFVIPSTLSYETVLLYGELCLFWNSIVQKGHSGLFRSNPSNAGFESPQLLRNCQKYLLFQRRKSNIKKPGNTWCRRRSAYGIKCCDNMVRVLRFELPASCAQIGSRQFL